jgi:multisubunit Na+/H+ antiporter MnhC subunit
MHPQYPSVLIAFSGLAYLILLVLAIKNQQPWRIIGSALMLGAVTAAYFTSWYMPQTFLPTTWTQTFVEAVILAMMVIGVLVYISPKSASR